MSQWRLLPCVGVEVGSGLWGLGVWAGASLVHGCDLCPTAGSGDGGSAGSCKLLISPTLTLAQLIDSTLWDSARKLSGPRQINHRRGFLAGSLMTCPGWPSSHCLFTFGDCRKWLDRPHVGLMKGQNNDVVLCKHFHANPNELATPRVCRDTDVGSRHP